MTIRFPDKLPISPPPLLILLGAAWKTDIEAINSSNWNTFDSLIQRIEYIFQKTEGANNVIFLFEYKIFFIENHSRRVRQWNVEAIFCFYIH